MLTLDQAVGLFTARQDRSQHPDGRFDSKRRWEPSTAERRPCCGRVRSPSAAYPYSLLVHCRTAAHVAALAENPEVTAAAIRREALTRTPAQREGGDNYFKAVAVTPAGYRSIYDGLTAYELGVEVAQRPRQEHGGGIYVYGSLREALLADVPSSSALYDAPRVVLQVRAEGAYCRYSHGKLAFARVTPLRVAVGQDEYDAQREAAWAEARERFLAFV